MIICMILIVMFLVIFCIYTNSSTTFLFLQGLLTQYRANIIDLKCQAGVGTDMSSTAPYLVNAASDVQRLQTENVGQYRPAFHHFIFFCYGRNNLPDVKLTVCS